MSERDYEVAERAHYLDRLAIMAAEIIALRAQVAALEAALRKIAQLDMAWPEDNYPCYAGMAVVTAREAIAALEMSGGVPR